MAQHGDHAAGQALPGGHASRLHDHHAVREARRAPPARPPARATHPPACARHPPACARHAHAMHAPCTCHHALAPCPCAARAVQARTSCVGCSTCATRRRHASCRATPAPPPAAGRSSGQGTSRRLLGRWTQADSWARGQHGREALASAGEARLAGHRRQPLPPPTTTSGHASRVRDAHRGSARVPLALGK